MTTEKKSSADRHYNGRSFGHRRRNLLKAAASGEYAGTLPNLFAIDDPNRLQSGQGHELDLVIQPIDNPAMARSPSGRHLPVLPLIGPVVATPGEPTGDNASAVIESIELATAACSREKFPPSSRIRSTKAFSSEADFDIRDIRSFWLI